MYEFTFDQNITTSSTAYTYAHHHHLFDNTENINPTWHTHSFASKKSRGSAKWSMVSFDGVNVEMLDYHKRLQWKVSVRWRLQVCLMTFMCPRGGASRFLNRSLWKGCLGVESSAT